MGEKKYVPKLLLSETLEHLLLQWVLNIFRKETGLPGISHPQGTCQKSRAASHIGVRVEASLLAPTGSQQKEIEHGELCYGQQLSFQRSEEKQ